MDIHGRLDQLTKERGWSRYRLSKECGLGESTISNMYARNTVPSLSTIEAICNGLDISLAEFFSDGKLVELDDELQTLFKLYSLLTPEQKKNILDTMKCFTSK